MQPENALVSISLTDAGIRSLTRLVQLRNEWLVIFGKFGGKITSLRENASVKTLFPNSSNCTQCDKLSCIKLVQSKKAPAEIFFKLGGKMISRSDQERTNVSNPISLNNDCRQTTYHFDKTSVLLHPDLINTPYDTLHYNVCINLLKARMHRSI